MIHMCESHKNQATVIANRRKLLQEVTQQISKFTGLVWKLGWLPFKETRSKEKHSAESK